MDDYLIIIFCILLCITIYFIYEYIKTVNRQQTIMLHKHNKNKLRKEKKLRFDNNDNNDLQSLMNVNLDKYKKKPKNDNESFQSFEEESNFTEF